MAYQLCSIVLAGGRSQRFGGNKLFATHPVFDDQTLLSFTVDQHQQLNGNDVWMIGGAYHDLLRPLATQLNVNYLHARQWQLGQSESIKVGVSEIFRYHNYTHGLIGLSDQPLVSAGHLLRLKSASMSSPNNVIVSRDNTLLSAPAIFPSAYFPALMALTGDKGAGGLIRELAQTHPQAITTVDASGLLSDIDTKAQWVDIQKA